jgi:hypothetical protein
MSMVKVRMLRLGEEENLPAALREYGVPKLDHDWAYAVTPVDSDVPFAMVVTSYASGLLVVWRLISVQPLPQGVTRTWFLEASSLILESARSRGCVGVLSLFSDDRDIEQKLARLLIRFGGAVAPFKGSLGAVSIVKAG